MNYRLAAVLLTILAILMFGWGVLLWYWKRTLDAAQLRSRQTFVRKWSAVLVFIILGVATIYWRVVAAGLVEPGPGSALFSLAAIVGLIEAVAVRGLWYFTRPGGKLPWLNTVAYRVTITTAIIAILTIVTVFDFRNLSAAVAFSEKSNRWAADFLQVFAFLIALVSISEFFLQRILPNPEDEKGGSGTGADVPQSETQALTIPRHHSVVMAFDFPSPIKVFYGQYLLYFKQFLEDVEVQVETSISEEDGRVLFSVTPLDKQESLHKIRRALELYLHLPSERISDTTYESIAAQRLEATILNLKAQLKLVGAELQAKEAALRAQEDAMIQLKKLMIDRMLSGEILLDSMEEVTPKPEDPEPLIPGLVVLGPYQLKGVTINLGEILRRLKKFFSREEA